MAMDMGSMKKKGKLANMKMPEMEVESEMGDMEMESEMPESEDGMDLEAEMAKPMEKGQKGADALAVASDEELMAELKKRGLSAGGDMGMEMDLEDEQQSY